MPVAQKSPLLVIDQVVTMTVGQATVLGPIPGDYQIISAIFTGNTAAIPTVNAGKYDTTTGTFTSVTALINGLGGGGQALGATKTALEPGVEVTLVAAGPIASGQYLRVVAGTNALARFTLTLVSASSAATFAVSTTPAV